MYGCMYIDLVTYPPQTNHNLQIYIRDIPHVYFVSYTNAVCTLISVEYFLTLAQRLYLLGYIK